MKVGFVGLGKLGLPCATCISMKGHDVMGHDLDPTRMSILPQPYQEAGPDGTGNFNDWLGRSDIHFGTLQEVADHAEIIFVAVQTPHNPKYEGVTPLPDARVDFDYGWLCACIKELAGVVRRSTPIVVISTCLPGTMAKYVKPLLNAHMHLVYNPFFIAMGSTMRDFLHPEFILMGTDKNLAVLVPIEKFYGTITDAHVQRMSIESAELTKVAYNTFISLKIAFANTLMEICNQIPNADVDEVTNALKQATTRLISGAYLSGGMGDGGGCHPRDNIAMSWLAQTRDLSFDIFEAAMACRQEQAQYLANLKMGSLVPPNKMPLVILGYAFKPESNLTVGSPALLVANLLEGMGKQCTCIDHHVVPLDVYKDLHESDAPCVILIGCKHPEYATWKFPKGSIVIDPHRYIPDQEGVLVDRLGEGK